MPSAAHGVDFAIVQRISGDVGLVLDEVIDSKREIVCLIARVTLSIEDELNDSGTDICVEERGLVEIEEIFLVSRVDGSEAMRYWRKVLLVDHNLVPELFPRSFEERLGLRSNGRQAGDLKILRMSVNDL